MVDMALIISILGALGGFLAWVYAEIKSNNEKRIDLEKRFSDIEKSIAVNDAKDASLISDITRQQDEFREVKSDLKNLEGRTSKLDIDLAVLRGK
ncbi:hypothetical protein OGV53_09175 [Citrobacter sp. Cb025]|uniref:hypothetical protein n=1 Tax=Citrobacter TaxID=544 RepID=UPI0021F44FC9|nr:hypothetical protein [Citrobacter sp. Cb025]MCV8437049.1 hypothetical protein [Escherichia coli]MDM3420816.1 hypothetical protein [Citrobacter sp. Cb025]HEJ0934940.1 hypothetical protein [Escherichia coli]